MLGCACKSREGPALKNVLFAWELGRGLGHLMNMRRIAARLKPHGIRFIAVSRDPAATDLLGGEFAEIIKSEVAVWARVVKDAGITAD